MSLSRTISLPGMRLQGWTTDLAVLRLGGSRIDDRGDHFVVTTPANPGYHWGNCLFALDGPDGPDRWLGVFTHAFPDATHRAIALAEGPSDPAAWADRGMVIEREEVHVGFDVPPSAPLARGYTVRRFGTPADWACSTALRGATDPVQRRFEERLNLSRSQMSAAGHSAWFGAFDPEGDLAAELGIVDCGDGVARYQSVFTAPEHRRLGLTTHLLAVAAAWAKEERGAERWVIVADADSIAAALYRSRGFALAGYGFKAALDGEPS